MDTIPAWVSGGSTNDGSSRKWYRAVEVLRKEGKEITEAAAKELYIKYGGKVLPVDEPTPEPVITETPVEEPKKKAKKAE